MTLNPREEALIKGLTGRVSDLENLGIEDIQLGSLSAGGSPTFTNITLNEHGWIGRGKDDINLQFRDSGVYLRNGNLDIAGITDGNVPYMSASGFADSPLSTDGTDSDFTGNIELEDTTASTEGVVTKGATRFIHNFHHPTGNTAIPVGKNVFIGKSAGNFTMGSTATSTAHGSYNIAIGAEALSSATIASRNIAIGHTALKNLTEGYGNFALGSFALYYTTTGHSNSAVGHTALQNITTGYENVGIGNRAGYYIANGTTNNTVSNTSVYIGAFTKAGADGNTNETVIGYDAIGQGSNTIMLGNSSVTDLYCYDTTITSPSDRRIKTNIEPLDNTLGFINDLKPATFQKTINSDDENIYGGMIAQDVQEAMKKHGVDYKLVSEMGDGMLSLRYTDFIPALIGAIKELSDKVDRLERRKP